MVDIRLARAADATEIGRVLARAFAHDPVTSWVTRDPGRRERVLLRLNTAIARHEGIPRGATYVAEAASGIVGAAVWQPPARLSLRWRSVPFALTAGLTLGRDIPRMTTMGRAAARARPHARHWYLQLLGVDPDAQHTGVGSALLRAHLAVVDSQRLPAYLETTAENLSFYERLGFGVAHEISVSRGAPLEFSLIRSAPSPV